MDMAQVAVVAAQFGSLTEVIAQFDAVVAQLVVEKAWPGMVEAQLVMVEIQLAVVGT